MQRSLNASPAPRKVQHRPVAYQEILSDEDAESFAGTKGAQRGPRDHRRIHTPQTHDGDADNIRLAHTAKRRKGERIEPSFEPGHGEKIFVFNHFLDGMTVYSHDPVLKVCHIPAAPNRPGGNGSFQDKTAR
ncbi:hypothetical protein NUW58_g2711 [Xylaria curta]|uniref:Uncharacterized protein n=1 Tax=Xylaria curta TaxID=42375 RepID=A0ACC1PE70_9PEZI|nr:hypothetical protein NUW58_g2711 [Xylaria curta]